MLTISVLPVYHIPTLPNRQVIALYSYQPTFDLVKGYRSDCVYDDKFAYADDLYKMAGQYFALSKLFRASANEVYGAADLASSNTV